jgi:ubiquinone/menaquinone biosynthesis C-methylase UbiE
MQRRTQTALQSFFALNGRLADSVEPLLPQAKVNLDLLHDHVIAHHMNRRPGQTVVDVGGGRSCRFAKYRDPNKNIRLVAVDISAEELSHNVDVDERLTVDIVEDLAFGDCEIDIITSRSVVEHLPDVEAFIRHSARVLRPGGYMVHAFPSKFAPFSLINQVLPHRISERVVHFLIPGSEGRLGFRAYYDRCYYSGFRRLLERHGYEIVDEAIGYYQSRYFDFLFPLYALSALYELLLVAFKPKDLAARVLIVARKPTR